MPGTITVRIINGMTNADDKDVEHLSRDFLIRGGVNSLDNYALYDDSFNPTQNGTPDTNTLIDAGIAYVSDSTTATTIYYCVQVDGTTLVPHDATAANPRIDAIVIEIPATSTTDADAVDAAQFSVVKGAEAASPTAPSDGDITTDLGHSRWLRIANVTISNPFVTVVDANIDDVREICLWNLKKGAVPYGDGLSFFDSNGDLTTSMYFTGANAFALSLGVADQTFSVLDENSQPIISMGGSGRVFDLNYGTIFDIYGPTNNGSKKITLYHNDSDGYMSSYGALVVSASPIYFATTIFGNGTNTYDVGSIATDWKDGYFQNPITVVSDVNEKENITESPLGLDFIVALSQLTKSWTWKNKLISKPVLDQDGNVQYDEDNHVIMESIMQTHHRKHHGLLAQDVEALLAQQNINTEDFAGFIKDEATGKYGLRMGEFYAPIFKAIGELKAMVDALA